MALENEARGYGFLITWKEVQKSSQTRKEGLKTVTMLVYLLNILQRNELEVILAREQWEATPP